MFYIFRLGDVADGYQRRSFIDTTEFWGDGVQIGMGTFRVPNVAFRLIAHSGLRGAIWVWRLWVKVFRY